MQWGISQGEFSLRYLYGFYNKYTFYGLTIFDSIFMKDIYMATAMEDYAKDLLPSKSEFDEGDHN